MSQWSNRILTGFENLMKYTRGLIALSTILLMFAFLFTLLFVEIPHTNVEAIMLSIGFLLGGGAGAIYGYYYGTTKDKSDSDQSKIFPKEPPNP